MCKFLRRLLESLTQVRAYQKAREAAFKAYEKDKTKAKGVAPKRVHPPYKLGKLVIKLFFLIQSPRHFSEIWFIFTFFGISILYNYFESKIIPYNCGSFIYVEFMVRTFRNYFLNRLCQSGYPYSCNALAKQFTAI